MCKIGKEGRRGGYSGALNRFLAIVTFGISARLSEIIILPSPVNADRPITIQMAPTLATVYTAIPRLTLRHQIARSTLTLLFCFQSERPT